MSEAAWKLFLEQNQVRGRDQDTYKRQERKGGNPSDTRAALKRIRPNRGGGKGCKRLLEEVPEE